MKELVFISQNPNSKWKPESLLDYLLAKKGHKILLSFFGGQDSHFQPSEIFIEKRIPDRVFWTDNQLYILELKIRVNSKVCSQLGVQKAIAQAHYVEQGSFISMTYANKYEAALKNVKVILLSVYHPTNDFENLLINQGFLLYSLERGVRSQISLDYDRDPLPLVIADWRAQLNEITNENEDALLQQLNILLKRPFTIEERLFLHRYPQLLQFRVPKQWNGQLNKLQEVTNLTESDLKQIILENLYLLSPKELSQNLDPEKKKKLLEILQEENPED